MTATATQVMPTSGRLGGPIEKLLVECSLTVFIVLAHFASDISKNQLSTMVSARSAGVLAAAYTAATLVSVIINFFSNSLHIENFLEFVVFQIFGNSSQEGFGPEKIFFSTSEPNELI